MKRSTQRILTTHVGSLPRNETLSNLLMSQEAGESYDKQLMDNELNKAVRHVVDEQKKAGIDIGNDGEQQRERAPAQEQCTGGEQEDRHRRTPRARSVRYA